MLDDVETKISKHQSTIATHINNTPQVCTMISCFVYLNDISKTDLVILFLIDL